MTGAEPEGCYETEYTDDLRIHPDKGTTSRPAESTESRRFSPRHKSKLLYHAGTFQLEI